MSDTPPGSPAGSPAGSGAGDEPARPGATDSAAVPRPRSDSSGPSSAGSGPPDAGATETRTVRRLVSARGATVGALAGYLFGAMGFYTNFFETILQATAILLDVSAVLALVALIATGTAGRLGKQLGARRVSAGAALLLGLLTGATYVGVRPPGVVHPSREETCVYDVGADDGTPIPLKPGGSITQRLRPATDEINSVSVIAGLDKRTARLDRPHAIKTWVHTTDGAVNRTVPREDIVDNAFSRFEFPEPLAVRPRKVLVIEVFNDNDEPVSIYVKQPGPSDLVSGAVGWAFIQGHVRNEHGYEKTGFLLSGCVTTPGD